MISPRRPAPDAGRRRRGRPACGATLLGLFASPSRRPLLAPPGARRLQRRLADRHADDLNHPHMRCLDIEIEDKLELGQILLRQFELQRGVGVDDGQVVEFLGDGLGPEQA